MELSWNNSDEMRERAIEQLLFIKDRDMHLLLQPNGKDLWDGAAEVITRFGYPRIKIIIPMMLEWLQDMNWPGSERIAQVLNSIGNPLVPYVQAVMKDHPSVPCDEFNRGVKELIYYPEKFRKHLEENKVASQYCNHKSSLQNYLMEIEELREELSDFTS
ncbi:DUF5071 domain-containing protein [Paenibacillus cellulosilyticus]|nr:DUF5071 domain-containing protein [Paenibacillus cellulosilyticus]